MKSAIFLLALVACLIASEVQSMKSFRNHKVVSFRIENEKQLQEMQNIETESGFVFIDSPVQVNMKVELVVDPEMFEMFVEIATDNEINFEINTDDLQSWIDMEKPLKKQKVGFSLDQYNLLDDIYDFLERIQSEHPARATIINIGESYEGRPLKVIKISTNENNPVIFIEANIHAREWISSATALWTINELLTTTDPSVKAITESVTWYILPVTNPDGYQYTHDEYRLWRKTRSIHNIFCRGVDPNRNFGYNFRMGGSSRMACTDTYMGPEAFSEKETKAVMDFYATIANKSDAYISFHSAAEMLLYPMGHTNATDLVPNVGHLIDVGQAAVDAIERKYGVVYRFGNIVTTLYVASGSSVDHAYGQFGTPIAYTYEFRVGRGTGSSFILPPEEIIPNSEEIFDSLLAIITKGKELGYFNMKA